MFWTYLLGISRRFTGNIQECKRDRLVCGLDDIVILHKMSNSTSRRSPTTLAEMSARSQEARRDDTGCSSGDYVSNSSERL